MGLFTGTVITAGILDPLYTAFGWCMLQLYLFVNNYGFVIILFTIILRALLLPLSVQQHKNMIRQQALSKDQAELARIYGDDKMGLQQAQQELMKKHGISQTGGCLLSILQLFLIWPIYRIITAPLKYIAGLSDTVLDGIGQLLNRHGLINEAQVKLAASQNIPLINALNQNPAAYAEAVNQGLIRAGDVINLDFFGMNLGLQPTWRPALIFGEQMATYLPLLIIPLVAVVTSFLVSKVQEWTNPMYWRLREEKELAKNNPARTITTDNTMAGMNKTMKWIMPLFTLFTVFSMPAAMGLYWIVGNVMAIVPQVLFFYLYTKPAFADMSARTLTNADIRKAAKAQPAADSDLFETEQTSRKHKGSSNRNHKRRH